MADELFDIQQPQETVNYTDDNIIHLSDMEHVRTRPGMYIGRLGDGSLAEDGIYVLLKEVIDNSIDEFKMNAGKRIEIDVEENKRVTVRDYGRGIPQGKLIEAVSVLNTGGKYDSKAFKKSVGLNGVGVKAVNALSLHFEVRSYREGQVRTAVFERGNLLSDQTMPTEEETGTFIAFEPDDTLFKNYSFHNEIVETMLRNYTYLNTGLIIMYNGRRILSRNARRHPPECLQGAYRQNHQGVLRQEFRVRRHPKRARGRHCRECGGTHVREPDQDKARLPHHEPRRGVGQ